MRLLTELAFSAFRPEDDSDGAAAALQEAGYEVVRIPVRLRHHLDHACDDYLEVIGEGPPGPPPSPPIVGLGECTAEVREAANKFTEAVFAVLEPFGGEELAIDLIDADYVPFSKPHWGARWDPTQPSDVEPYGMSQ
jgi:hypothetical protein